MTKSMVYHHLLQYFIINLNIHISQHGHAHSHPTMTIHTIYQHLLTTNAPVTFQMKMAKKFRPNIAQLTTSKQDHCEQITQTPDDQPQIEIDNDNNINNDTNNDLSTYVLQDEHNQQHYIQYDPVIHAFRHRTDTRTDTCPKIICDACGLPGHPASRYFRRGFHFLPRDVQRRITAYNTKYGAVGPVEIP